MPSGKEIRTKIKSVQNTRKITKAMEMVAASKMRKAQERMKKARPYGDKIRNVAAHMSRAHTEYHHPFLLVRDTPQLEKLIGAVKIVLDGYTQDHFDRVYIFYTRFINTMKQEPVMEQLLPLTDERIQSEEQSDDKPKITWDYIYEPEAKPVIDDIMVRYVEALIYQAVTENMASEQSARMVAMKAASDNAGSVIDELTLIYNKSRQAAITKELSEIVGGAAG